MRICETISKEAKYNIFSNNTYISNRRYEVKIHSNQAN